MGQPGLVVGTPLYPSCSMQNTPSHRAGKQCALGWSWLCLSSGTVLVLNLCCDAGRASGPTPTIPLRFLLADHGKDVIFLMLAPDFFFFFLVKHLWGNLSSQKVTTAVRMTVSRGFCPGPFC